MEEIFKPMEEILREDRVKQSVVAERLRINTNSYSQYINTMNDIPLKRLSRIADILGFRLLILSRIL